MVVKHAVDPSVLDRLSQRMGRVELTDSLKCLIIQYKVSRNSPSMMNKAAKHSDFEQ